MDVIEFYERCAAILGAEHNGQKFPYHKRTRWNNRTPGAGRFEGFGTIRHFSECLIQVSLLKPVPLNAVYDSHDAVFEALKKNNKHNITCCIFDSSTLSHSSNH